MSTFPQPPLSRPEPEAVGFFRDCELRLEHPRLKALLAYWEGRRGDRLMPARPDIRPAEIVPHLPGLILCDLEPEPLRLRFRLIGTAVTAMLGRDSTGRYLDDCYPAHVVAAMLPGYRWMLEQRRPFRTYGRVPAPGRTYLQFERLNLPLSQDGSRVDMVLSELVLTAPAEG